MNSIASATIVFLLIAFTTQTTKSIRVSPSNGAVKATNTSHSWHPSNLSPADRFRRLIPYMTFYIPTNEYNLPSNENYRQNAAQKPDAYEQSVVNYGQPIRLGPVSTTTSQPPSKMPTSRGSTNKNRYNKYKDNVLQAIVVNRRPVKPSHTDLYEQQPSQQLQSLHEQGLSGYNTIQYQPPLKQSIQQQYPQAQHIHQSKVVFTPFLPSNQIPGAFRPIIPNEQYETSQPNTVNINTVNNQYQIEVEQEQPRHQQLPQYQQQQKHHIEVIPSTPKPFYLSTKYEQIHPQSQQQQHQPVPQQQQHQPQYGAYLRPQPQYVQVVKTTPRPTIAAEDDQQFIYHVEHVPVTSTTRKPTIKVYKNSYKIQTHSEPQFKPETGRLAGNDQLDSLYAKINYDLDPNDGYSSRIPPSAYRTPLTPSNRNPVLSKSKNPYLTNYKTIQIVSSTSEPAPVFPSTEAPRIQSTPLQYQYESVPVSTYHPTPEPATYRPSPMPIASTTTAAPRQHHTETTQIQPPTAATFHPNHNGEHYDLYNVNNVPKYKTTVLNRVVPVVDEPHYIVRPSAPVVHPPAVVDFAINTSSISSILKRLQDTNHLPQTITPDNIDNSIRTLVKILNNLKTSHKVADAPPQHYSNESNDEDDYADTDTKTNGEIRDGTPGPNTGRPGIDYPALYEIPPTSFNCKEQRYKGFFGDPETHCQVWHYCDLNGGQASFLCPNGTIFSQVSLTCDWWFNVKCSTTAQLYVLNERLYKYILPFSPKFPEDYSGPLVDKYLAIKFQEMEEKMNREKNKNRISNNDDSPSSTTTEITSVADDDVHSHNIDMADQLPPSSPSGANNYLSDVEEYDEDKQPEHATPMRSVIVTTAPDTELHANVHERITLPSNAEVESEKLEVIEIRSDGSSGHLTPGHH